MWRRSRKYKKSRKMREGRIEINEKDVERGIVSRGKIVYREGRI